VVGEGIKIFLDSHQNVTREDIFVVTKIWMDEVEDVDSACKRSLDRLGLDYVDLYLMHWTTAVRRLQEADAGGIINERINMPVHKVWPQMEALVDKGLTKSIGISNFNV